MAWVYLLNPGEGMKKRNVSQKELELLGGQFEANPKRRHKRKSTVKGRKKRSKAKSNVGGKRMARTKVRRVRRKRKRNPRGKSRWHTLVSKHGVKGAKKRYKKKKRTTTKKKASSKRKTSVKRKSPKRVAAGKKAAATRKRKSAERSAAARKAWAKRKRKSTPKKTTRKKKSSRKRSTTKRKDAKRSAAARKGWRTRRRKGTVSRKKKTSRKRKDAKRSAAARKGWRTRRRKGTARKAVSRKRKTTRRKKKGWKGQATRHKRAAKLGWRRRYHNKNKGKFGKSVKKYKKPRGAYIRGGKRYYPVIRNPRNFTNVMSANLRALWHPEVIKDAVGITAGSLGAPIATAYISTMVSRFLNVSIPVSGPVGFVTKGIGGAVLATGYTAITRDSRTGKNMLLGTAAGLLAEIMKTQVMPRLPFFGGMSDYATLPPAMNDYATLPPGMDDYLEESVGNSMRMSGMGAYASANEFDDGMGDYIDPF